MSSRRLIRNMGFYFLGIFSTKMLQFLFIPLYSKYIEPADFGYYSLTVSIIALLIPLLYQSIWEGILRFIIEKEGDERNVLTTASIYCFGLTILYSILFLITATSFNIQFGIAVLIMGICQMGVSYWQFSARALKENRIYAISTVVQSVITILLNIILIMVFKWGLLALFIANTVGNLVSIIILEANIKIFKGLKKEDFNKDLLKSIIKYSFPLSVNAVSWWLINSFNTVVITYKIGIDENGIYSLASRFGTIMALITSVVTMAWIEESFRSYDTKESDTYFNSVLDALIRAVFSAVALLIPVTYVFYQLFVFKGYGKGVILTPVIYLTAAYSAIASHLASVFLARKESNIIFKTTLIGGLVSAIGGFWLAESYGSMGVVVTSLIGFIVMCVIRIPMIHKRMNLRINYAMTIGMTGLCLIVMIICNLNAASQIYQLCIFVIVVVIVGIVNKDLLKYLLSSINTAIKQRPSSGNILP